jgi:hypothetical protein
LSLVPKRQQVICPHYDFLLLLADFLHPPLGLFEGHLRGERRDVRREMQATTALNHYHFLEVTLPGTGPSNSHTTLLPLHRELRILRQVKYPARVCPAPKRGSRGLRTLAVEL